MCWQYVTRSFPKWMRQNNQRHIATTMTSVSFSRTGVRVWNRISNDLCNFPKNWFERNCKICYFLPLLRRMIMLISFGDMKNLLLLWHCVYPMQDGSEIEMKHRASSKTSFKSLLHSSQKPSSSECFQILWLDETYRGELPRWVLRWVKKSIIT